MTAQLSGCHSAPHSSLGLCSAHCYTGTVDQRVAALEKENEGLRNQLGDMRMRLMNLSWLEKCVNGYGGAHGGGPALDRVASAVSAYQSGKIGRQRQALLALQKKKWTPDWIIYEENDGDDRVVDDSYEIVEDVTGLPYLIEEPVG